MFYIFRGPKNHPFKRKRKQNYLQCLEATVDEQLYQIFSNSD